MGASYAREKLDRAVYALATGTGTIQERLVDAFIMMSAVSDHDFQGERLEEWRSIYKRATTPRPGAVGDGNYQKALLGLNDDEASKLAGDICELNAMMDMDLTD